FIDKLLDSIVGFEIEIDRMEGKWKLSQNHTSERRSRVVDALRARGDEQSVAIADLMSESLEEHEA
ncbi:MAG: FMN-binding negative transcriptional regulator, partial [Planctomycetaceae bacterium]|nr:FMN-binding negative transcriptional regulator [Planctomycetaceae bacterium]